MTEDEEIAFLLEAAKAKKAAAPAAAAKKEEKNPLAMDLPNIPNRPMDDFPNRDFKVAEDQEYNELNGYRSTKKELIERERLEYATSVLPDLREGAEVHRRVRMWAMENVIKPGVNLYDMCAQIEEAVRRLSGYQPVVRGLAFPCGCSINNCAAHYTPVSPRDTRTLGKSDVMKIDFGVSINGSIIDSAFTVCFDPKFEPLLQASREATNVGVKMAGIDQRLDEIGDAIQEVMDASSIDINGKHYDIKPIRNLSGHSMKPYTIHAGKCIPICKGGSKERMEEGELYACETFASTGKGMVHNDGDNLSHFMVAPNPQTPRTPAQRKLLKTLQENFSTLAFTQRFLDRINEKKYQINLRQLCECHAVHEYPALSDCHGSYVSQFEHTFILLPTHKEILSRGPDY
jgi:methionyl aminopeptidase